jgi:hypothetical protein
MRRSVGIAKKRQATTPGYRQEEMECTGENFGVLQCNLVPDVCGTPIQVGMISTDKFIGNQKNNYRLLNIEKY